jgi:hypothetical protein
MAETGNFLSGRKRSPLGFAVSQPIPAQGSLEKRFIIAVIVVSHGKPTLHVGVLKFVTAASDSRIGLVFGGVDC